MSVLPDDGYSYTRSNMLQYFYRDIQEYNALEYQ